jgi:putative hydrolase of the HAD superfamily
MALKFIIFDLDETLYPRSNGLMREIGRRIQTWLCDHMGLTWDEAVLLRDRYYRRYGTTLGGLVAEHEIDAQAYLAFVHDIPLEDYIHPNPALGAMLDGIPLRKVVYTNASADHGWRVLNVLGVADYFERVIGIEEVGLRNKPRQDAYEQVLVLLDAWGPECIMVEDSARNLRPAKALGMTTVLIDAIPDWSVNYVVRDVLQVGQVVSELLESEDAHRGI